MMFWILFFSFAVVKLLFILIRYSVHIQKMSFETI